MRKLSSSVRQWMGREWPAAAIVTVFLLLAASYSIITPIFESPDELWHYPFVWHLVLSRQLPVQDPANPQLWGQEGSQPPLYYALAALLTGAIPADDLPALIYRNPHADIGLVSPDGNANIVVHTGREDWPWQGAVLAIHLSRFFSIALGAGTVVAVYGLGRTLWPERRALAGLAMAFAAFNPMFLFISGSVNNDNLIILLASLVVWQLVALVVDEPSVKSKSSELFRFVILGALIGLAALTKVSGLGLLGLAGLTALIRGAKRRSWQIAILGNLMMTLITGAIAGWWYWRNFRLYGDWTGTENMVRMMGARPVAPTVEQLLAELPGLLRSFWGLFGYFSVPMPEPVYWLLSFILVVGLAGLPAGRLWPRGSGELPPRLRRSWPVLAGWLALMIIGLAQWTLRTPATQGRLLFPALPALAVLWAAGWLRLFPGRWSAAPGAIMLVIAAVVPWAVIAPAYAPPPPVAGLPPSARPLQAAFGEMIELAGYDIPEPAAIEPGERIRATLYWRGLRPVESDYSVFIHLVDQNDLIIAQRDVFHGPGVYPTSRWAPGTMFADRYSLELPRTAFAPVQAQFRVGLYDHKSGARLATGSGAEWVDFGQVAIRARPGPLPNPQALIFEDGIELVGYSLDRQQAAGGEPVVLTLYWQGRERPAGDYKVFVHLAGPGDVRAAQHDSAPQNGAAPTSGWSPGQVVTDEHTLTIAAEAPPGAYHLIVGLYEEETGRRLRLLENDGRAAQADSIRLAGVRVAAP